MTDKATLLEKRFRGCLMGALIGDCFGAPFEGNHVDPLELVESIEAQTKADQANPIQYTDDTAMTMATCRSLIQRKGLNSKHMATEFTETYFKEPKRGYGGAVVQVFTKLRDTNYKDPYGPASKQFDGSGSFGNGAAMRCSGIGLFSFKMGFTNKQAEAVTTNCSRITHSHPYGINGALILVTAIRYLLNLEEDSIEENAFIDHIIQSLGNDENQSVYTSKLKSIKEILTQTAISGNEITQKEIVTMLGNDVSAQNSVPLAIYSFLRGISKFTDTYRIENEFFRTLHWAISCGGDTDTIASMACALSGCYLGIDKVPENMIKRCEAHEEILSLADQLLALE